MKLCTPIYHVAVLKAQTHNPEKELAGGEKTLYTMISKFKINWLWI